MIVRIYFQSYEIHIKDIWYWKFWSEKDDVRAMAPPKSYIHTEDFATPKDKVEPQNVTLSPATNQS